MSPVVLGEILVVFVNTFTPDGKYLVQDATIWNAQFKCNYLENEKLFLDFLFHFWNLHLILNILKEKVIVIPNVFPKLETVKNLVRRLSKEQCFKTGFGSQHVKASQILAKSP